MGRCGLGRNHQSVPLPIYMCVFVSVPYASLGGWVVHWVLLQHLSNTPLQPCTACCAY